MSFRAKLFIVSLIIPALALTLFLYIQLTSFTEDKVVFIYEMQNESLRSASLELSHLLGKDSPGSEIARRSQPSGEWESTSPEFKSNFAESVCAQPAGLLWITKDQYDFDYWFCRRSEGSDVIFEIPNREVLSILTKQNIFSFQLIDSSGMILADDQMTFVGQPVKDRYVDFPESFAAKDTSVRFVIKESGGAEYFASSLPVNGFPLRLVALIPRTAPEKAALPFLTKGVIGLIVILLLVAMIALVISRQMTQRLQQLINGVQSFGSGKLDYHFDERAKDEFGQLARVFNKLVKEIKDLVSSLEEKAKVEKEMSLAALLQQKFLPKPCQQYGSLEVHGQIRPAEQCGGDWWFLIELEDSVVLGIGDVTGHGINSAMITSASRGALAAVQNNFEGVGSLARTLNHAIYETAQESLQMTLVCMEIKKDGSALRYCNASHEPSFLYCGEKVEVLADIHGPRLGQEKDYDYSESTIEINNPDWQVWLFTDGATDVVNPAEKRLGDRLFMQWLQQAKRARGKGAIQRIFEQIDEYRSGTPQADDICLVLVRPYQQG